MKGKGQKWKKSRLNANAFTVPPFSFCLWPFTPLYRQNGFTYITALIFIAVMGIGLNTAGQYWSTIAKREKEKELLFRGDQIRRAIESYYKATPGGRQPEYARTFKDLLIDPRYPGVRRHLRKSYKEPLSGDGIWGMLRDSRGGIKGVFSKNTESPLKTGGFPEGYEAFEKATIYSDWKFVHAAGEKPGSTSGQQAEN